MGENLPMGFYSKTIFPAIYDWVIDRPFWAEHREYQLRDVTGEILEIGVGTGLNLPHYPDHVKKIVTVDPNPGMNKRLQRRIDQTGLQVDRRIIGSECLPFEDDTFDSVVSTLTLCSIRSVDAAMSELFRVLKPGGRLFFLEHGLSKEPKVAKWQQRLNGMQRRLGDGCSLTLDMAALIANQPFGSIDVDNFYLESTPKTHGYMYRGVATK